MAFYTDKSLNNPCMDALCGASLSCFAKNMQFSLSKLNIADYSGTAVAVSVLLSVFFVISIIIGTGVITGIGVYIIIITLIEITGCRQKQTSDLSAK